MSIILGLYVKDVVTEHGEFGDRTIFTVVNVVTHVARTVMHYAHGVWTCNCSRSQVDPALQPALAKGCCDHIRRAELYSRNMIAKTAEMKRRVKSMAAENKQIQASPTVPLLEAKRKIKLEDD